MVFFTVNSPNRTLITNGRPMFTNVVENQGGGYNLTTAIFTCPFAGLYYFSMTFIQSSSTATYCFLYHNNAVVTSAYTAANSNYQSASASAYVYLNKGDTFDVRDCGGWNYVHTAYYTVFTGALVTAS